MLPTYVGFAFLVGLAHCFGGPSRFRDASYAVITQALDIPNWGIAFIFIGLFIAVALVLQSRIVLVVALSVAFGFYLVWAGGFIAAAYTNPDASFTRGILWFFVATAHYASLLSVTKDA